MDQIKTGKFLKELRKEKGITQQELADKLGVSGRSVSRWETGTNMPDIALLVDIADFYEVDVRELIEGEKNASYTSGDSESVDGTENADMMNEELREVAEKMADYADTEKSKLLRTVRLIGIIGSFLLTISIVLQGVAYNPSFMSFGGIVLSFGALLALVIVTLYVNGILQKMVKKSGFSLAVKVCLIALVVIAVRFLLAIIVTIAIFSMEITGMKRDNIKGLENYNKQEILKEYRSDLNSPLMTFPDDVSKVKEGDYHAKLKYGLLDTDGYLILEATYEHEDYLAEVDRLSNIECTIEFDPYNGQRGDPATVTNHIKYDETMYKYPAYIASDGFDEVYEYALIDEDNDRIIYVILSYPESLNLSKYKDYIKPNTKDYSYSGDIWDTSSVMDRFTIYYGKFDGIDGMIGYTDPE